MLTKEKNIKEYKSKQKLIDKSKQKETGRNISMTTNWQSHIIKKNKKVKTQVKKKPIENKIPKISYSTTPQVVIFNKLKDQKQIKGNKIT